MRLYALLPSAVLFKRHVAKQKKDSSLRPLDSVDVGEEGKEERKKNVDSKARVLLSQSPADS